MCRKITTEQFILEAKIVHKNRYVYSDVKYVSAKNKVSVKCRIHGFFLVSPDNHISRKSGCPKCGHIEIGRKTSIRQKGYSHNHFEKSLPNRKDIFLKKAIKIYSNKYDYSKVFYKNSKTPIIITCIEHGDFSSTPFRHLRSKIGCPLCADYSRRKSQEDFINKCKSVHGGRYDYSKTIYNTTKDKVHIICPLHEDFLQMACKHISGQGCPKCRSSHGERAIRKWLIKKGLKFKEQKMFKNCLNPITKKQLKFDFYVPKCNMCIEFDGEQHFRPSRDGKITIQQVKKIQFRDRIKEKFCDLENIKLLRIPYTKLNRIDDILMSSVM